jgi:hypothetical protein
MLIGGKLMLRLKITLVFVLKFVGLAVERRYAKPSEVGFQGWIEAPLFGIVAFRELDGSLLFMW